MNVFLSFHFSDNNKKQPDPLSLGDSLGQSSQVKSSQVKPIRSDPIRAKKLPSVGRRVERGRHCTQVHPSIHPPESRGETFARLRPSFPSLRTLIHSSSPPRPPPQDPAAAAPRPTSSSSRSSSSSFDAGAKEAERNVIERKSSGGGGGGQGEGEGESEGENAKSKREASQAE